MAKPEPSTNSNGSENNADGQKYKYKFRGDSPIELESDDFLSREGFSQHLSDALCSWMGKESLVVALNGPWGSGKTSIINLMVEIINAKKNKNRQKTGWYSNVINWFLRQFPNSNKAKEKDSNELPTIIHFNPWVFSEEGNIQKHFFDQVAKELELKKDSGKDKKIAKKLRYYSNILDFVTPDKQLSQLGTMKLVKIGFFAVFVSLYYTYFKEFSEIALEVLYGLIVLYVLIIFSKSYLSKFANFFESRSEYRLKPLSEVKKELQTELRARGKKLLIIIDDIDRLDADEIRPLLKLIRENANFPNTIYLLIFDREVVQKYLDDKVGVQGKDYLGKIVQVSFDIPHVNPSKILRFLMLEITRIIDNLPPSAGAYFESDQTRWRAIRDSGFKDFFKSIRDVKRYANSLEFNISKMQQGDVMEVNTIDFVAIEAIRVFLPELYLCLKRNKDILIQNNGDNILGREKDADRKEVEKELNSILEGNQQKIKSLIGHLFPQIESNFYGHGSEIEWSNNLRVCSVKNFDSYFTLFPGGDEDGISEYQLQKTLTSSISNDDFELKIREFIKLNKGRKILIKIHEKVLGNNPLLFTNRQNVISALFNIADDLQEEEVILFDLGQDGYLLGIILLLLSIKDKKYENYDVLREAVLLSVGIIGPIAVIDELGSEKAKTAEYQIDFPVEKLNEIFEIVLGRIAEYDRGKLFEHRKLLYILSQWKLRDRNNTWEDFLDWIIANDERYILFLTKFISINWRSDSGEQDILAKTDFNFNLMKDFLDPDQVKLKLEELKADAPFYEKHQQVIDIVLKTINKK
jgi:Cdc6-like AAA superfamily ATPase